MKGTKGVKEPDVPLVGTLRFVMIMGGAFAVLWFGMYLLLRGRW